MPSVAGRGDAGGFSTVGGWGWSPLSVASVAYGCRPPKPQRAVMEAATGAIGFPAGARKRGHRVDALHPIPIVH